MTLHAAFVESNISVLSLACIHTDDFRSKLVFLEELSILCFQNVRNRRVKN